MAYTKEINLRLVYSFDGTPWYGDSVMGILKKIPFDKVNQSIEPLKGKTISHLVQHMVSWQLFILEKLNRNEGFDIELVAAMIGLIRLRLIKKNGRIL